MSLSEVKLSNFDFFPSMYTLDPHCSCDSYLPQGEDGVLEHLPEVLLYSTPVIMAIKFKSTNLTLLRILR